MARASARTTPRRRDRWLRGPPWALGGAVFLGLLGAYASLGAALGFSPEVPGEPPWARSDVRGAAVVALLTGYVFAAAGYARRGVERCMSDLRRVLCCSAGEHAALERAALAFFSPRPTFATIGGALFGIVAFEGGALGLRGSWTWDWDLVWWLPVEATLMGMIGAGVYAMVRVAGFFSWLGENIDRVDLFNVSVLEPFARFGLRSALLWIVGASMASLFFIQGGGTALVGTIMAAIVVLAALVMLLPLRGVRRRMRKAKGEELDKVQEAIHRERDVLVEGGPESRSGNATMASLLAYRDFVESIREWPLDASTLMRFALYVGIGLGSWVGAALVERLVGAVMP